MGSAWVRFAATGDPNGPGLPEAGAHTAPDAPPAPRAIIVPPTEFSRGGPAYAWGYRALLRAKELPAREILGLLRALRQSAL